MPYVPGHIKIPWLKGAEWESLNSCYLDQALVLPSHSGKGQKGQASLSPCWAEHTLLYLQTFLGASFGIFHFLSYRKSWTNSLFLHLYRDVCIFLNCVSQFLNYSGSWDRVFCQYYQWINIMTVSCFSVLVKANILGVALLSRGPVWFAASANFSSLCPPPSFYWDSFIET